MKEQEPISTRVLDSDGYVPLPWLPHRFPNRVHRNNSIGEEQMVTFATAEMREKFLVLQDKVRVAVRAEHRPRQGQYGSHRSHNHAARSL